MMVMNETETHLVDVPDIIRCALNLSSFRRMLPCQSCASHIDIDHGLRIEGGWWGGVLVFYVLVFGFLLRRYVFD
jgi:hypothetical protein